jgi:hypothetical protein
VKLEVRSVKLRVSSVLLRVMRLQINVLNELTAARLRCGDQFLAALSVGLR